MTYGRHLQADIAHPPYTLELTVLTSKPLPLSQMFNLLRSFTETVWGGVLVSLGIMTFYYSLLSLQLCHGKANLMWYSFSEPFASFLGQSKKLSRHSQSLPVSEIIQSFQSLSTL